MNRLLYYRFGLGVSLGLLLISLAILLWPLIQTPRFWLTLGMVLGMIGSFVFALAIQREKMP